jgi:branched-chain amino acid transport system ATP-binding protein
MSEVLLSVRGLRSGYGSVEVLRGIDLDVSAVVPAHAGTVHFDGRDITSAHYREVVALGLIHVPEGRRIFPNLSVLENLELGSFARARANRALNLERVFAIFPRLKERTGQMAGTMSGGEQQMLAIGRGLMGEPRLLILDEPSLGLSPLLVEELFGLIARLHAQGLAILLVEQNVAQSLEIAQRAYVMENGAIQFSGTSAELLATDRLRLAYLGV